VFDGRDRDLPAKCLIGIRHGGSEEADRLSATGRKTPREKDRRNPMLRQSLIAAAVAVDAITSAATAGLAQTETGTTLPDPRPSIT
jgi:hypothetical protein